ncbi:MFS transporter [Actinomadura sp. NPDC047616]|uniref:MFS transporter n=1 Tax=Actinomadura sp. NPDC047616 TaxID=3155914 RepID=UPI0033F521BA
MTRTTGTLTRYAALGCLGYVLAGLGAILPELRAERDLPRGEAALYPSGFALGLVVVGLVGPRLVRRLGAAALPVCLAALAGGCALLAFGGGRVDGGAGAVLLGLGGAGLVQIVPAELRAAHADGGTVAIGEANAVSSAASVLAPLVIGFVLGQGLGWRAGFLVPPVAVAAVLLVVLVPGRAPAVVPPDGDAGAGRAPRAFRTLWVDLVLAVAVEFCVLFWAADFLHTGKGLPSGGAAVASTGFVLGMAVGRALVARAIRLAGDDLRLLCSATALATVGFAVFWAVPAAFAAVGGLFVTGLGVALLYPVTLGQALAAWPERPVRAAARCALASGVAVGAGPPLLGSLADLSGMRAAFLLAPTLLLVLLTRCVLRLVSRNAASRSEPA